MMNKKRKSKFQIMTMSIENTIICFIIGSIFPLQTTSTTIEIAQLVGRNVSLNCTKSSSDGIIWKFNEDAAFYTGRDFRFQFRDRSRFETDSATGKEILKISDIKPEDAGLYKCLTLSSETPLQSTQLTVLGSDPICYSNSTDNEFVGPNECGNTHGPNQDDMQFSCAVSYYGTAPRLQWKIANTNKIFNDSECDKNEATKRIHCTLTLKAEPQHDGSVFRCKVLTSHGEQYNCSTKAIKVLYFIPEEKSTLKQAHKTIGDEISCSVNSTLNLNFSWIREENDKKDVVGTSRSYVIDKEGFYCCNVSYSIKDVSCWTVGSVVHTHHTENLPVSYLVMEIILIVLACFFGIIFIMSIVVACGETKNTQAKGWLICAAFAALVVAFISLLAALCICCKKAEAPESSKSQKQELQELNKERDDLPKAEVVLIENEK